MTEYDGVVPALGQALSKRGYTELTPVQTAVLAPELTGADALVSAQTGSGKTVAFGLALAPTLLSDSEHFNRAGAPLALAVAPTRELALQVKRELEWLYAMTGASVASCVGGMDMRTERRALQNGAHIVVGTPGRLRDHIERGSLNTKELRAVVLDEADEMLDLGFREDLEYILDAAPSERRTLMFSATVPRSIANLAKRYQRDAVRVTTQAEQKQHVDIEYRALTVAPNDRENAIVNVLRYFEAKNALVFCSTRATVNHMTSRFSNRGFSVVALSGELNQNERTHALQAMRDGRARVCVATDVAARGLDLPNLELVIHADLPNNGDTLLHRSGRTGRAGRKGVSALIVPHTQRRRTERLLQNARITATWAKPPSVDEVNRRDDERLLADPALSDPLLVEEQAFVLELLASHGAEQVAAAFVRLYRAGRSAPEELLDVAIPEQSKPKRRDDFANGVWFNLTVGRKQNAEARWLLPMLCRVGHITKHEIGAIRIHQEETHVELEPGCVERFLEALGPDRTVEKSIDVTRIDGIPDGPRDGGGKSLDHDKPRGRGKPDPKYGDRSEGGPKRKFTPRPDKNTSDEKRGDKPWKKNRDKPARFDDARHGDPNPNAATPEDTIPKYANSETGTSPDAGGKPWLKRKAGPGTETRTTNANPREKGARPSSENARGARNTGDKPHTMSKPGKSAKSGSPQRFDPLSATPEFDTKPGEKPAKKTKGKKPFSSKLANPNARAKVPGRPGSEPLKRKKPKKKPAN